MKKVKRIFITTFALFLLQFMFMNLNLMAKGKSKKPSLEFYLSNHYLSTSFEPEDMNRAMNHAEPYDNLALYLIDYMLFRGSGWDALEGRICINTEQPIARGRVLSKSFSYKPGDVFPFSQERSFALSKSGMPFQAGVSIPFSSKWSVALNYYQSEKYSLELAEAQDDVTIKSLERFPEPNSEYSWWEMQLQRNYEKRNSTYSFRNIGAEVAVRHDLLGSSQKMSLSPEVGVSLGFLKRKLNKEIEYYGYRPTLFPEIVFPGSLLDDYRDLNDTKDFREDSTSKLRTRFFAGLNLHFYPVNFLGFSCTARIYNNKLKAEYSESSLLGDFPFDMKASQFLVSIGITLSFSQ